MTNAIGDCYYASFTHQWEQIDADGGWLLCHGTVVGTGGDVVGKRFGHAWLENPELGLVLDVSMGRHELVPLVVYYAIGQVREVVRYNRLEAGVQAVKHNHYGPWHESEVTL